MSSRSLPAMVAVVVLALSTSATYMLVSGRDAIDDPERAVEDREPQKVVAHVVPPNLTRGTGPSIETRSRPRVTHDVDSKSMQSKILDAPVIPLSPRLEALKSQYPLVSWFIDGAEGQMANEGKDPVRASQMETRILSAVSANANGLKMSVLDVDCRTTICRVQMVFTPELIGARYEDFPDDAPWTGQQPISFFMKAMGLQYWSGSPSFLGGVDENGVPIVLTYVSMPSTAD